MHLHGFTNGEVVAKQKTKGIIQKVKCTFPNSTLSLQGLPIENFTFIVCGGVRRGGAEGARAPPFEEKILEGEYRLEKN